MNGEEEQQFAAFVRAKGDRLLRFARLLIIDRHESEDALQVALIRLAKHWSRTIDEPEAYVRTTLVNLATDRARRRHLVAVPVQDSRGETGTARYDADALAAQEQLDALLAPLSSRQRTTVVLRIIEGYSERETAQLMRCAPGTVKSNLARGLDNLRARAATAPIDGVKS